MIGEDNSQKIIFLYQLERGEAGGSYGINVAALAGLSGDILTLAQRKSCHAQTNFATTHKEFVYLFSQVN